MSLSDETDCLPKEIAWTNEGDCKQWQYITVIPIKNVAKAVKEYVSRDWMLFMKLIDGEISYKELLKLRIELENEIFGEKLI